MNGKVKEIILVNPNSLFNQLKRWLAFAFGAFMAFILFKAVEQTGGITEDNLFTFIVGSFLSCIFLVYAIFRNKIYKKCFVKFDDEKISMRLPDEKPPEFYLQYSMFSKIINPTFIESQFLYKEIERIEIKTNRIILTLRSGIDHELNFSGLDYKELRQIKEQFTELKDIASINRE